ncbi:hypothetical protein [Roseomonas sp. HF4]|uniref:hypothetical protein n=1 Tax=Roseomonas sp. HF4 TaxID=2562313 RepID=UPI0010C042C7|nr:hypothetical protein [Roseomonas sp. HF4]
MSAVVALLAAARSRLGGWLAAAGAVLAALLTAYAAGRRDGRSLSETERLARALRAREVRDAVERDLDRSGDADGELHRDWRRR